MPDIYDWSLTALDNAGADNIINWSEGQAPHTVNDSARAMMQRVREYLSCSGGGFDGVVEINYSEQRSRIIFKNSVFSGYKDGFVLGFRAVGGNIGRTTIYREGLPAKPIYKATENGLSPLVGGEIAHGCLYSLVYDESISGWQLLNPTIRNSLSLRGLPTGFIGCFAMERLPAGWLLCDGRSYSRDKYRDLFATIGTLWGQGGDDTTFNVPDLRGMFLRGFDYIGSVDRGRHFGSVQQSSLREHEHSIGFPLSSESPSRTRRDSSSVSSRSKRSVIVDFEILESHDEECLGLSGDALRECSREFDRVTSPPAPEELPPQIGKAYTSHPFFLRHDWLSISGISNPSGTDLGEHDHFISRGSFGGIETRPVNVSVVYGIKT